MLFEMVKDTTARAWFCLTALVVFVGLAVQLVVTAGIRGGHFPGLGPRLFNLFCFFTIQANLIVGVTCLLLAVRLDRRSTVFGVFRLSGLIAIIITFLVFHTALKELQDLKGSAAFADLLLHTLSPVMCAAGWLVFGPRRLITRKVAFLACVFPLCWSLFTLVRGPLVDFYPYPFVDVRRLGYSRVLLTGVGIGALFLALAAAAAAVERMLSRRSAEGVDGRGPVPVG